MADAQRITCIVPVYNAEAFLAQSLDSALAQTRPPDEIILVDDGSTDGSAAVAKRYDEHVTYAYQANGGPAAARNRALDMAQGSLIAFLDADDWWHPEALERHLAHFAAQPALQISLSHVEHVWEAGTDSLREHFQKRGIVEDMPGYLLQASVMRRDVFETVGRFDDSYTFLDDIDWFSRARHCGIVMDMMADVLTYRRMHGENITVVRAEEGHADYPLLIKKKLMREREGPADKP